MDGINADKKAAARTYIEAEHSNLAPEFIAKILEGPRTSSQVRRGGEPPFESRAL